MGHKTDSDKSIQSRQSQYIALREKYRQLYGDEPILVRSPGRINLIGEHTDYNEGFVMPAAIDRDLVFAIGPSPEPFATIYAAKPDEFLTFDPDQPTRVAKPLWANYLLGVARRYVDQGYKLKSFRCLVAGDVPTGAGLSSSAALECGFTYALNEFHSFGVSKLDMIHIAQWAEHHYAGVKCGIMDQFASMMGQEGKAFVLDCRSLDYTYFPIDLQDYGIVLCDTMVKHSLADTAYNKRRQECEQATAILQQFYPEIRTLRDATLDMVKKHGPLLTGKIYDRCTYIILENERVLAAAQDLQRNDLISFGQKMYASHDGLSNQYEVSCTELDFLVETSRKFDYVVGARMMGGGFGGCTINLVRRSNIEVFIAAMSQAYLAHFNMEMKSYVVAIKDGTSIISLDEATNAAI